MISYSAWCIFFVVDDPKEKEPPIPQNKNIAELVLFVGSPASGKTTFYQKHFDPAGYIHVNQDKLGTRPKCLKLAEEQLKNGISCVIGKQLYLWVFVLIGQLTLLPMILDNTNRDKKTRELYVRLAKSIGVPIR